MHGIGGRTITEAQASLPYPEFIQWLKYRRKHGSLDTGQRVEQAVARLSALYANAHRKQNAPPFKWQDFSPHYEPEEMTLDQAMKEWA